MVSNTDDKFSPHEQAAIDHNDSCYRVLIRNIVYNHVASIYNAAYDVGYRAAGAAAAIDAAKAAGEVAGLAAAAHADAQIRIDDLQKQLVDQMKENRSPSGLIIRAAAGANAGANAVVIHDDHIKAPFNNIFIFYYVSIYHPEIFTFGTMMSIGLSNHTDYIKLAKDHFDDEMAHFSDDGLFHYNIDHMRDNCYRPLELQRNHDLYIKKCIKITKICIKYTRYFIDKYPQVATQSLKLFISLFTKHPISHTLIRLRDGAQKPLLERLHVPSLMRGGGDEVDLLPLATDIAMNMYELHYSLRIKAAYSDRKMEDLYEERRMQIVFYNEAIQEMEAVNVEPDPYRLALLEYERHILCKQFVELPKFKEKFIKIQQTPLFKEEFIKIQQTPVKTEQISVKTQQPRKSTQPRKSNQQLSNQSYPISVEGRHEVRHGGRLKKTRKNRKMKKLKQSYKKTKAALRKSRKH